MSELITLTEAVALTTKFRNDRTKIIAPQYASSMPSICQTFTKADIETLLAQPGCVSLRIYGGMNADGTMSSVLVGVNSNDEDILAGSGGGRGSDLIVDKGAVCPPNCPPASPLNS